jgi:hypothetical protein
LEQDQLWLRIETMKAACFFVFVAATVCIVHADPLRAQIESSDRKIHACFMRKDADGFAKLVESNVAPGFRHIENGRSIDFKTMVSMVKQSFAMFKKVTRSDTVLISLKEKGDRAVAVTSHVMAGTVSGPDHKPHTMSFSGRTTDTYVKKGGKWLLSSMDWGSSSKMTMDGKPFDPTKMGGRG